MTNDILNYQNKLPSRALICLVHRTTFLGVREGRQLSLASLLLLGLFPDSSVRVLLPTLIRSPGGRALRSPGKLIAQQELHCPLDLERLSTVSSTALFNYKLFSSKQSIGHLPLAVPRPLKQDLSIQPLTFLHSPLLPILLRDHHL